MPSLSSLFPCSKDTTPPPAVMYTLIALATSGGTVNPTGATYAANTVVAVTATANTGYAFSHWSGNANGNDNPLSLSMSENKSIQANFTQQLFTLEANVSGEGSMSQSLVSTSKTAQDYTAGSVLRLLASPSSGCIFSGWSGAIDPACQFIPLQPENVHRINWNCAMQKPRINAP